MMKKILFVFLALLVLSLVGGYFYFNNKFEPPSNYLSVSGSAEQVPVQWIADETNPYLAVLLPVQLEGFGQPFYMQLDFGSPITVFYKKSLASIPVPFAINDSSNTVALIFGLGGMQISSDKFRLLNYGDAVNIEKSASINIIGTIGTDLLEKKTITLDFVNAFCSFNDLVLEKENAAFEFSKRKILIPATIGKQQLKLLYDSGTSGYELITGKNEWESYRTTGGTLRTESGNSWGNTLKVVTAPANEQIQIANVSLKLTEVTHIEGTSSMQNMLMKVSGMQGMIGNKLFLNHKITIDCKNERFRLD